MAQFPSVGDDFGSYRITGQLGRGGMGVVFAAEQRGLGRTVALKVLSPELAEQPDYRERFAREATVLARLDSPHVIQIYDHGEHDGCLYIATQYVAGGDLSKALTQHGAVPTVPAAQIAAQLAWALADAHGAGVVHRDMKPSNVLLRGINTDVFAYLCDFGIAQDRSPGLTMPGSVAGTFAYLAPERLRGEAATPLADLYALGCVLFTALTGATPYAGSDVEIGMSHLSAPVPRFVETSPVASHVNEVLRRSMAKDPGERYPSAAAMRSALQAVVAQAQVTPHPPLVSSAPTNPVRPPSAPSRPSGVSLPSHPSQPSQPSGSHPRPTTPPPPSHPSGPHQPTFAPPPYGAPARPSSTRRRTGLVVAAVVAAVLLVAGGVAVAVAQSRGGDETADPEPTSSLTDEVTDSPTESPTTSEPPSPDPTTETTPPEPDPTTDPPKPEPEPFYPAVPAATGPKVTLGKATIHAPAGWGMIDEGESAGIGARDYNDGEGYYSSVFIRRTKPPFPFDSISLLNTVAESAIDAPEEAGSPITKTKSQKLGPAWLDGERAARVRAAYHNSETDLNLVEESWFVQHGDFLYRVTFQHSQIDTLAERRAQIDPMVVSFRWAD